MQTMHNMHQRVRCRSARDAPDERIYRLNVCQLVEEDRATIAMQNMLYIQNMLNMHNMNNSANHIERVAMPIEPCRGYLRSIPVRPAG